MLSFYGTRKPQGPANNYFRHNKFLSTADPKSPFIVKAKHLDPNKTYNKTQQAGSANPPNKDSTFDSIQTGKNSKNQDQGFRIHASPNLNKLLSQTHLAQRSRPDLSLPVPLPFQDNSGYLGLPDHKKTPKNNFPKKSASQGKFSNLNPNT